MRFFHSKARVLIFLLGISFFIYIIVKVIIVTPEMNKSFEEFLPQSYELSPLDSSLFRPAVKNRLKVEVVYNNKMRKPISFLSLDNRYELVMFRIDCLNKNDSVNVYLKKIQNLDRSVDVTYNVIPTNLFSFQHKTGPLAPVTHVIFSFDEGEIVKKTISDSVVNLQGVFKNAAIKYSDKEPQDIFIQSKTKTSWEVLFLRKGSFIYFLAISPYDLTDKMPINILYSLV
jgi:hypothetical protein